MWIGRKRTVNVGRHPEILSQKKCIFIKFDTPALTFELKMPMFDIKPLVRVLTSPSTG